MIEYSVWKAWILRIPFQYLLFHVRGAIRHVLWSLICVEPGIVLWMDLLSRLEAGSPAPLLVRRISTDMMIKWISRLLSVSGCCDYIFHTDSFPVGGQIGRSVSLPYNTLWMINPSSIPLSKALGKSEGHTYLQSLSLLCCVFAAHAEHRADVLILLPAYISWSGLCNRCSTKCFFLHCRATLLQSSYCICAIALQILKDKLFTAPFPHQ